MELKVGICPICGGKTEIKNVDVQEMAEDDLYIFKGIEAEVCTQCGERLYSENAVRKIESLRKDIKEKSLRFTEVKTINAISIYPSIKIENAV